MKSECEVLFTRILFRGRKTGVLFLSLSQIQLVYGLAVVLCGGDQSTDKHAVEQETASLLTSAMVLIATDLPLYSGQRLN